MPLVIFNIFKSNRFTHIHIFFLINCNWLIKLPDTLTCNKLLPNPACCGRTIEFSFQYSGRKADSVLWRWLVDEATTRRVGAIIKAPSKTRSLVCLNCLLCVWKTAVRVPQTVLFTRQSLVTSSVRTLISALTTWVLICKNVIRYMQRASPGALFCSINSAIKSYSASADTSIAASVFVYTLTNSSQGPKIVFTLSRQALKVRWEKSPAVWFKLIPRRWNVDSSASQPFCSFYPIQTCGNLVWGFFLHPQQWPS